MAYHRDFFEELTRVQSNCNFKKSCEILSVAQKMSLNAEYSSNSVAECILYALGGWMCLGGGCDAFVV